MPSVQRTPRQQFPPLRTAVPLWTSLARCVGPRRLPRRLDYPWRCHSLDACQVRVHCLPAARMPQAPARRKGHFVGPMKANAWRQHRRRAARGHQDDQSTQEELDRMNARSGSRPHATSNGPRATFTRLSQSQNRARKLRVTMTSALRIDRRDRARWIRGRAL